jgi:release factor glutamine methyltransferase
LLRAGMETLRASGSETARLDAELLLGHVLQFGRAGLLAAPEAPVGADHAASFAALIERRTRGEPVAYIRGLKEFYGLVFAVDPRALIPRPETELAVDLALERLRRMLTGGARPIGAPQLSVWDVGTGSGAICVSLAVECRKRGYEPDVRFRATDASEAALGLAIENAVAHGVADMIEFAVADLVDVAEVAPTDLLLANLPYIPSAEIPALAVAASFEPLAALDGGPDGLGVIRRLIGQLEAAVTSDGAVLLEIGAGQASEVQRIVASALPGWDVAFHDDLAGIPRVADLSRANLP